MIPAAWLAGAAAVALVVATVWHVRETNRAYDRGYDLGVAEERVICQAAQDRAEREHRSEVARIADAASVAAADALQARQTVRRLEHAARINPPVQCDAGDAGVDRLRGIINPAGDPAAGSPAR